MDEIWEEIDMAEAEGQLYIEVSEYRLDREDILVLEGMGYKVRAKSIAGTLNYYVVSWELA